MPKALDRLDRRILDELQADARLSNQELAKRVGLSPAPCWRRLRRLEKDGLIAGHVTLLNGPAIGLPIVAYAMVTLDNHHPDSVRQFDQIVADAAGSAGVPFDERHQRLSAAHRGRQHGGVRTISQHASAAAALGRSVNTSFVLRTKKFTTRLPVLL